MILLQLQGHGPTADTGRPMTIEALAGDVVALLDHLRIDARGLMLRDWLAEVEAIPCGQ